MEYSVKVFSVLGSICNARFSLYICPNGLQFNLSYMWYVIEICEF